MRARQGHDQEKCGITEIERVNIVRENSCPPTRICNDNGRKHCQSNAAASREAFRRYTLAYSTPGKVGEPTAGEQHHFPRRKAIEPRIKPRLRESSETETSGKAE